jgi:Bacterial Ig-like domain (group 2)
VKSSRLVLILIGLVCSWSCSGSSSSSPTTPTTTSSAPTVSSVAVSGGTALAAAGQTSQLTATATFSNGTTQNVTATATWQSSNAAIATITSSGVVTAVGSGAATITATYQGRAGTIGVTISLTTSARNTMTAVIDGVSWVGQGVSVGRGGATPFAPGGFVGVGGSNGFTGQYSILSFGVPAAAGTYAVNSTSEADAGLQIPAARALWSAGPLGGSGTITLSTLTPTSASGTFSFTMVPLQGTTATGTKTVTNGVFNVTF